VGGERAPGEGEEGHAPPSCSRRELACRELRATVGEEPAAGTRWHGGVGEKVWEHLHFCQGGRPPPGGGDVRRPREQRSSLTWCASGVEGGRRGSFVRRRGREGAGECWRRRRSALVLGRWEGNPVGRGGSQEGEGKLGPTVGMKERNKG
jgi:hypothetical protein